jgi:hypothetical protein
VAVSRFTPRKAIKSFDHRPEHRLGGRAFDLLVHRTDPTAHCLDRIDIFLEYDLLYWLFEFHLLQPTIMCLCPVALPAIASAVPQQERQQSLLGLLLQMLYVSPRSRKIAQPLLHPIRHPERPSVRPPDAVESTTDYRAGRT